MNNLLLLEVRMSLTKMKVFSLHMKDGEDKINKKNLQLKKDHQIFSIFPQTLKILYKNLTRKKEKQLSL